MKENGRRKSYERRRGLFVLFCFVLWFLFFFLSFFFCFSLFRTTESCFRSTKMGIFYLFWVYQNGNFLSGKSISRQEKNQEKMTLPPLRNIPVTPLIFMVHSKRKWAIKVSNSKIFENSYVRGLKVTNLLHNANNNTNKNNNQ